jgi:hypothetical protein
MHLDILFLDIDGVLNPDKIRPADTMAEDCTAQMRRFFEARPGTRIVLSTTWRLGFHLFALGWLWHEHKLPMQAVIGRTPDLAPKSRGQEIQAWLRDAQTVHVGCPIRRYAVLDDELDPLMGWVPRKNIFLCNTFEGLTHVVTEELIRHFEA